MRKNVIHITERGSIGRATVHEWRGRKGVVGAGRDGSGAALEGRGWMHPKALIGLREMQCSMARVSTHCAKYLIRMVMCFTPSAMNVL